ncbi:hypothetical protein M569_13890 [Genlisea aurea]|uniref:Uncharacterized protein n=1 Tax=Genlisea aurea TaxID=192259 RepID=S8C997_9LAMI|nr:hypothetical protein M569_13890 [Genlisea aurea]
MSLGMASQGGCPISVTAHVQNADAAGIGLNIDAPFGVAAFAREPAGRRMCLVQIYAILEDPMVNLPFRDAANKQAVIKAFNESGASTHTRLGSSFG